MFCVGPRKKQEKTLMNNIFKRRTKTLKDGLYDTLHHGRYEPKDVAEHLGMTLSYIYRATTPVIDTEGEGASGVRFPAKQLVHLMLVQEDFQVLDILTFQCGRVTVPIPKPDSAKTTADLHGAALDAIVKFGKLMEEIRDSLADGKITEEEQDRIDKEGI